MTKEIEQPTVVEAKAALASAVRMISAGMRRGLFTRLFAAVMSLLAGQCARPLPSPAASNPFSIERSSR